MEIVLDSEIIAQLSTNGVLAYLAVKMAEGSEATTAALAQLVKCRTTAMLDGLKELGVATPEMLGRNKNHWRCGVVKAGEGVILQTLDSERFRLFVDDLKKYWDHLQKDFPVYRQLPFQMGSKDGLQIKNFLTNHPLWVREDWCVALNHRKTSVLKYGVGTRTDPLWKWVPMLDVYAAGPVDKFGNQVNGNGKAAELADRNRKAREEYLARL